MLGEVTVSENFTYAKTRAPTFGHVAVLEQPAVGIAQLVKGFHRGVE